MHGISRREFARFTILCAAAAAAPMAAHAFGGRHDL